MPPTPEFIPLSKGKELLAVSSWRDSPGLHASANVSHTLSPSRPLAEGGASVERAGNTSDDEASKERARQARNRASRGRNGRHKPLVPGARDGQDVDDYFVHVFLPPSISFANLQYELRAQVTPLKMFDIGLPRALLASRPSEAAKPSPTPASAATADAHTQAAALTPSAASATAAADEEKHDGPAAVHGVMGGDSPREGEQKMVLLPFATPALRAAPAQAELERDQEEEEGEEGCVPGELPPDMALPPPELSATLGPATTTTTTIITNAANIPATAAAGEERGNKTAAQTPSQAASNNNNNIVNKETTTMTTNNNGGSGGHEGYQVSLLFAEASEAEKAAAFIRRRWPAHVTAIVVPRSRAVLNASLVLKALPSLAKSEVVLTALEQLPCRPSYVRLHRGERGVFKNVIFVKYGTREAAEESKLRLERLSLAARPLKVEFKKKVTHVAGPEEGEAGGGLTATTLPQLVRDLRVSGEHEGFVFQRSDLTTDELKLLKQLCQSYMLGFDLTEHKVTVRRYLGGGGGHHTNASNGASSSAAGAYASHAGGGYGGTTTSERPSPALRPQSTPSANTTPAWAPATPAPLRPMDFKGIRHWKEIHNQVNTLGILRPLGPDDGLRAFAAGRGRPL